MTDRSGTSEKHESAWRRLRVKTVAWLRTSLRRWLVLPMLVWVSALTLASILFGSYVIRLLLTGVQTQVLRTSSQAIVGVFKAQVEETGRLIFSSPQLEAVVRGLDAAELSLVSTATTNLKTFDGVSAVALTDLSGHVLLPVDSVGDSSALLALTTPVTLGMSAQHALEQMLASAQSEALIGFGKAGRANEPVFFIARAVRDSPYGALIVGISAREILYSDVGATLRSYLAFYDADGSLVLTTLLPTAGGLAELPSSLPIAETAASGDEPLVNTVELAATAYRHTVQSLIVNGTPLGYLALWQPVSFWSEVAGRAARFLLIAIGLFSVLILGLGWWLSGPVTRPVVEMARTAQAMAEGDFTLAAPETAVGELALLAKVLNRMVDQVRGHTDVLQEQASHSNYLFQASAELGRTLNLDESLQTAAEAIFGLGGLSYVVVMVGRGELGPYTCRAVRGLPVEIAARIQGQDYPVPLWGMMARALVSRQPLVIDDVVAENRPPPGEFDWDVGGSMLLFPVVGANEPSALIIVGTQAPGQFSVGSLGDMVFALARIAGHSILNAQLYQAASRSQEQLVTLQVISKVMASASDIEAVLNVIVRAASEIMGGSAAWLYIRESAIGAEKLYSSSGAASAASQIRVNQDAVSWVLRAGQPIFYDPQQPLASSPILVDSGAAMCVPLEVNEDAIGALVVLGRDQRRVFIEDDMIVLRTLANSAAAALQTAHLARRL